MAEYIPAGAPSGPFTTKLRQNHKRPRRRLALNAKRSGAPGASAGLRVESMGLSFSTGLGIHGHLTRRAWRGLLLTLFILLAACGDQE